MVFCYNKWNNETNTWIGYNKYEYEYDSNGNMILEISYDWDSVTNNWIEYRKYKYEYDSSGNKILEARYDWDSGEGKWIGYRKYQYEYDSNGNKTLEVHYGWDSEKSNWMIDLKGYYYYSNLEEQTGVWEEVASGKIDLYPNPASENFYISAKSKINRVVVANLKGSIIYNNRINEPETQISTRDFNTGMYILRVYTEDNIFVKKLRIQK